MVASACTETLRGVAGQLAPALRFLERQAGNAAEVPEHR